MCDAHHDTHTQTYTHVYTSVCVCVCLCVSVRPTEPHYPPPPTDTCAVWFESIATVLAQVTTTVSPPISVSQSMVRFLVFEARCDVNALASPDLYQAALGQKTWYACMHVFLCVCLCLRSFSVCASYYMCVHGRPTTLVHATLTSSCLHSLHTHSHPHIYAQVWRLFCRGRQTLSHRTSYIPIQTHATHTSNTRNTHAGPSAVRLSRRKASTGPLLQCCYTRPMHAATWTGPWGAWVPSPLRFWRES